MPSASDGLRQSDRINFRMAIEASWFAQGGMALKRMAHTLLVSRNGGVLRLGEKLTTGQELTLRRQHDGDVWKSARARVVAEIDHDAEGFIYAFQLLETRTDFWNIEFPAPSKGEDALARLLMECSFCQRREVVYLNPLELKSFEARRVIARICSVCAAPAVWIEAQLETPAEPDQVNVDEEPHVTPRRKRTRVKARVLACIRRRGFEEEVAVCEDLSKGGISFRSRNKYPEGSRLEIAVPYSPGNGAIFVPIRIVFSTPLPGAGLFKHGAAYVRASAGG
jgi:PilZ domain-containing protein